MISLKSSSEFKTKATVHEWPHLKGTQADYAKVEISNDRPDVKVYVVPKVRTVLQYTFTFSDVSQGAMVTMDFREDRVRIFVDDSNKVVRVPRIG
jgi:hypothetical protein